MSKEIFFFLQSKASVFFLCRMLRTFTSPDCPSPGTMQPPTSQPYTIYEESLNPNNSMEMAIPPQLPPTSVQEELRTINFLTSQKRIINPASSATSNPSRTHHPSANHHNLRYSTTPRINQGPHPTFESLVDPTRHLVLTHDNGLIASSDTTSSRPCNAAYIIRQQPHRDHDDHRLYTATKF